MHKNNFLTAILIISLAFFSACSDDDNDLTETDIDQEETTDETSTDDDEDYSDWSDETHSKNAELNYDVVFNQSQVARFDIVISSEDWTTMQEDLAANLGTSGGNRPGMGGGGMESTTDFDPVWVPCSFNYNDTEWYHVGIRFKGNSSLQSAYQSGNNKLSFKLDFDEFEDDYPAIKNQRFYGFKQLNLNNNYDDASLMREKVTADLFREFGVPASQTAFCVIYVDHGNGPQYYGVYTIVEEVDDTVIETQFSDDSGNLYKPDGDAASFAYGTFDTDEFYPKTNEDETDYSDLKSLYDVLHSSERTTDVETWKNNLEAVLNVEQFLKWLAANTIIQNWDTYGNMTHNYYLYNNPENSLLTWIPWDNNEALQDGKQSGALSLSLSEVDDNWPLISYLMEVPEYKASYNNYLQQFIEEVFVPEQMVNLYSSYYDLIKDYAYSEETGYSFIRSNSEFDNAVEELKTHVTERNNAVISYLQ
ncbi:CotH kinase family protein [Thermophagus sp. OGC60D27]|uniref:CotH kinase family protein n=1 Tax=Thermophagus sp. OGC60D27 TaxID=3458415 RepID=UPI0040380168